MKKILMISVLILFTSCHINRKNNIKGFIITGHIIGAPDSTTVIISNEHYRDSTILLNGRFSFSGKVDEPRKAILQLAKTTESKLIWLENTQITVNGSYDDMPYAKVTGGENQNILNLLFQKQEPILKLGNKYSAILMQGDSLEKSKRDSLIIVYRSLENKLEYVNKKFVNENPSTLESVILLNLNRTRWNRDSVMTMFTKMDEKTRTSKYGVIIEEYLNLSLKPQIGDLYTDFSLKNKNDHTVKLSQLMGNYTLIDFWASWCAPCREENPNLVSLFENYKSKGFNIIGVFMDSDKSLWIKAINDDGLPWDHFIEQSDLMVNNIYLIYGVKFIPDNLLIDKNGIIVARNLRGNELKEKLQMVYGVK